MHLVMGSTFRGQGQTSVISKIRHKAIPISAKNLLAIHDVSEISIKKLRKMMGDSREFFN